MIFDWIHYLTLAEELNLNSPNEAQMRSSISRSYYCVFHKAKILCLNKSLIRQSDLMGGDSHKMMYDRMVDKNDEDLFEIAKRMDALKIRRKSADYEADFDITSQLVNDTIAKSKTTINLISEYYNL